MMSRARLRPSISYSPLGAASIKPTPHVRRRSPTPANHPQNSAHAAARASIRRMPTRSTWTVNSASWAPSTHHRSPSHHNTLYRTLVLRGHRAPVTALDSRQVSTVLRCAPATSEQGKSTTDKPLACNICVLPPLWARSKTGLQDVGSSGICSILEVREQNTKCAAL
ncbi:hypothetical protein BCR34DRAFT_88492 [Clohesyomyces aquaticus]|uniref:Uncharacterized protein n=1 Tax=Clohesyomyces aquaticus TaxID=1231657 RepID=A0A1Y1YW16_9PLEO|nr:hypothetical protein BCR34DRAFT_88492 [Clohesyomyces aquaticus]